MIILIKIIYSPTFEKSYKKLSKLIKLAAEKKEKIFREDPHSRSLETHKLHGKLRDFWSFSVTKEYRIIF